MSVPCREGPDKGWSWVIAFAACFSSLVLAGIFRTSGVFFVAFINEYRVTREEASWPVVLCISVLNLTGIITGPLGQRFGVRPVSLVGSLIATIGISSCYFATSLGTITFCFGVVFGVGYGLVSNLMPVIVNEYFLNHRATANGIANSGSCFGSIILPLLFEFLIDNYGLSGCFLLTGGLVLQIAVSSSLMRPPPWLQRSKSIPQVTAKTDYSPVKSSDSYINDSTVDGYNDVIKSIQERNVLLKRFSSNEDDIDSGFPGARTEKLEHKNGCTSSDNENHQVVKEPSDERNFKEICKNEVTAENCEIIDESKDINKSDLRKSLKDLEELFEKFQEACSSVQSSTEYKLIDNSVGDKSVSKSYSENLNKEINSINGVSGNSKEFAVNEKVAHRKSSVDEPGNMHSINNYPNQNSNSDDTSPNDLREESFTEKYSPNSAFTEHSDNRHGEIEPTERGSKTLNIALRSFKKVLTCPMFYVTAATNVSFYFLFHMYVVIIKDFSLDRGVIEKETKYVLFAFSISDLFGRLCLGWITDRKFLRRSQYVMCCMTLIGVVFFSFPLVNSYTGLMVVSSLYGLLLGCTMVVFPILLVDFLGIEIHAVAFGSMCFMNGVASLLRPFLIGYFRDNIGSYSNIFYVLGCISLVASFLWLLEYVFVKTVKTNKENSTV